MTARGSGGRARSFAASLLALKLLGEALLQVPSNSFDNGGVLCGKKTETGSNGVTAPAFTQQADDLERPRVGGE